MKRLLAAVVASLCAIFLLGVWLPRVDIPVIDMAMSYWFVGVPITLLVTAGVANGFNLIDGVHGLATLTGIGAALSLASIADNAGLAAIMQLNMMLAAGLVGFLILNFPMGRIFLGDAGAYTIGFVISWLGIAILINAPDVSAWAIFLTVFWPIADTLLAVWRRSRRKANAMAPDRLHVHQMVMRALAICFFGPAKRHITNPLTTIVLAPFVLAPQLAAAIFWNNNVAAFLAVLCFGGLFFGAYIAAPILINRFRRRFEPNDQMS